MREVVLRDGNEDMILIPRGELLYEVILGCMGIRGD